ncbi:hypothetical protein BKD30_04200 [Tersicoccus phoenicis]|uniref:Uncharacterized protein n=1 Tax=Tersicoccus phoenicis TaxID=554083 RepID=A0A1R1LHS5_9MICC|nr:hypothetical protein [Tersicoccus phoenicis]OMH27091.1 hypothetical protein BKD30_04200 [Tersicoccus phoenicis]
MPIIELTSTDTTTTGGRTLPAHLAEPSPGAPVRGGLVLIEDTNPHAYRAEPAADSWQRALAFLDEHLPNGS